MVFKQIHCLIGFTGFIAAINLALLPRATAEVSQARSIGLSPEHSTSLMAQSRPTNQTNFEGRGVAQGSAFTRGRNASASLTVDRDNFGLELVEPMAVRGGSPTDRARVQYRGSIIRQTNSSSNSGNFTLDGRIQSFNTTDNLRVRSVTTGTCRIEVFDSHVISSTCNSLADNSRTQFLGLEQF
jgi:hypothetical protein